MIEDDLSSKLWSTDALSENSLDYKIGGLDYFNKIAPSVKIKGRVKGKLLDPVDNRVRE